MNRPLVIVSCVVLAAVVAAGIAYQINVATQPQYVTSPIVNETFVLAPAGNRLYQIGKLGNEERVIRVKFHSTSPVDLGVLYSFAVADFTVTQPSNLWMCSHPSVTNADFDCVTGVNKQNEGIESTFVLHDSRTQQGIAAAAGAAVLGSKIALDNESVRNDVTLTLSERRCIANCGGN